MCVHASQEPPSSEEYIEDFTSSGSTIEALEPKQAIHSWPGIR
jgi:hypothetical protein